MKKTWNLIEILLYNLAGVSNRPKAIKGPRPHYLEKEIGMF